MIKKQINMKCLKLGDLKEPYLLCTDEAVTFCIRYKISRSNILIIRMAMFEGNENLWVFCLTKSFAVLVLLILFLFLFFSMVKVVAVTHISLNFSRDEKELVIVDYIFDRNHCGKGDPTRTEFCTLECQRQRTGLLELSLTLLTD